MRLIRIESNHGRGTEKPPEYLKRAIDKKGNRIPRSVGEKIARDILKTLKPFSARA